MQSMYARRLIPLLAIVMLPALAFASGQRAGERQAGAHRASASASAREQHERTTWDSVFTVEQAVRGESTYARTCARCHGASLGGADESPALTGSAFMSAWNGQTLHDLHDRVRTTMPTDTPGVFSRQDVTDVIAFVLRHNGFPAGADLLPNGDEELKGIRFVSTKP